VNSVELQSVSKSYAIYDAPEDRLKELVTLNRWKRHRDFWALRDVSFEVRRGETFCIIGENGSGKSTLLEIVAGILAPTAGTVAVRGRVATLLQLGAGFNPEFTGHDNVHLNGALLGLTARQIAERYPEIAEFAGIGEFINQPVKTYSSGMVVRLAFAVAIHVDPEVLLVDEALAVGDYGFRQRCLRKVHALRARGVTILFVSHSASDVKAVGDRALWLDHGRVAGLGEPDRVVADYLAAMAERDSSYRRRHLQLGEAGPWPEIAGAGETADRIPNIDHRSGDGRAEVVGIAVLNEHGQPLQMLEPGSRILVRISVRANEDVGQPIVGFLLRNQLGLDFSGTNTAREGCSLPPLKAGSVLTVDFSCDLPELYAASFSFSPMVFDGTLSDSSACDRIDNAIALQMERSASEVYGYLHLPCRVEVNARMREAPAEVGRLVERSGA
jgi:ABC-type polysaccharide/polyol phosphate transport system ATPase subunit